MSGDGQFDVFVSVNPDLRSKVGHPYHLDAALGEEARGNGLEFVSLGHREPDDSLGNADFIEPTFSATAWEVFFAGSEEMEAAQAGELVEALEKLRERFGGERRILVYWYMASAGVIRELARQAGDMPNVVFCLHLFSGFFFEPSGMTCARFYYTGLALEELQKSSLAFEIAADSRTLIRDLEKMTGYAARLIPAFATQDLSGATAPDRAEDGPLRVVYPTDDSPKRGFLLLLRFLEKHATRYEGRIDFAVRVFPGKKSELARSVEEGNPNVELVTGRLEEEEFLSLLGGADVVILPYLRELFYYRTSSILYEAMTLKKPVAVIEDTWLSAEVESKGGGWSLGEDEESLREFFDELAERGRPSVEEKAREIPEVSKVGDLFSAVLSFSYEPESPSGFRPRVTAEEVRLLLDSEIEKAGLLDEIHALEKEQARLELIIEQKTRTLENTEKNLQGVLNSKIWRHTEPLRNFSAFLSEKKNRKK